MTIPSIAFTQSTDSIKNKNAVGFDSTYVSIFELIDSLVKYPTRSETGSTLVTRVGYNSNIVAASRTFGLNQFGLSPGFTYYHKSGLYLDATAYWSQEYTPNLYLAIPSAGFMKVIKKWTFNLEYSKYIFTFSDSTYNPSYTNALGLSNFFEVKPFLFRVDYSFYFGQKSAHRIMPGVILNLEKKNWLGFKRVILYPSFYVLFGNESWQTEVPYSTSPADIYYRILHHLPLTYVQTSNKFGILNYSINLPLSLSLKNWNLITSYTYNFQHALPSEPITVTNSGYLSLSIIRYFNFKSNSALTDLMKLTK
ncbi:MAG TPA: hypothetical protein DGG95_13945 [Cytophagales bacterium]|nr:hypothetical protein [Cytophagales bacterium]